jgi:RecA/RadA recombinase
MERICRSLNLDFEKDVKPYILHVPLDTVNQQLRRIEEAHEITSQYNVKVIVLDSITKLIRQERQADEAYTQRISRTINVMLGHLNKIKTKCDASLICTNQVYSNMMAYGSKRYSEETYGGSSVKHSLDKRLHVWNHKDGIRCAELVDSASDRCMGDTENSMVNFIITDGGIADVGD